MLLDMTEIKKLHDDIIKLKRACINLPPSKIQKLINKLDVTCLETNYVSIVETTKLVKESMKKLKDTGRRFTGVMFGWDNVEDGTVVPNWDEQDLIDYMRHLYMIDDRSAAWIARKINNDNNTGKKGGKWSSAGVLRTIRNTYHLNRNKYTKPNWWGDSYYHKTDWA